MTCYNIYIISEDGTRKLYGIHDDLMEAVSEVEYLEQMADASFEIIREDSEW